MRNGHAKQPLLCRNRSLFRDRALFNWLSTVFVLGNLLHLIRTSVWPWALQQNRGTVLHCRRQSITILAHRSISHSRGCVVRAVCLARIPQVAHLTIHSSRRRFAARLNSGVRPLRASASKQVMRVPVCSRSSARKAAALCTASLTGRTSLRHLALRRSTQRPRLRLLSVSLVLQEQQRSTLGPGHASSSGAMA